MAIGQNAKTGARSYVALMIEPSFGSFPATSSSYTHTLEFLSLGIKTEIASTKLDTISGNRGFTKRVQLDKNVGGTLEQYLHPTESPILLAVTLGGGISTTANTNTGATVWTHSISAGNFDNTISSIGMQVRKGDAHHWQYAGGRVNVLTITGTIGEPVKCSYEMVFKDSTQAGTDISGSLSISAVLPFTYVQGSYRYAGSESSLTSSAAEHITDFELTINNNLVSDAGVRSLGYNTIQALPATRREVSLKITQRFDTTTAWERFIQNTQGAVELYFEGSSITSEENYSCKIIMPKVYLNTPDVEIGGANEILKSEIEFDVLVDNPSTSTGRDIGITIVNDVSGY